MGRPRVLLCAPDRPDRALLADALAGRGAWVETFDPRSFPGATTLGLTDDDPDLVLAGRISAAWVDVGGLVGANLPPAATDERATCARSAEILLVAWLDGLGAVQVDPHPVQLRADDKVAQLRAARAAGLHVPATLVTNDAARVRAFAATRPAIVAKMLTQPASGTEVVFTTALGAADLADLDGLELCPMIFQERVHGDAEVRATVIGAEVMAAVLDRGDGGTDWRRTAYEGGTGTWAPYDLPTEVADNLRAVARRLGLRYGAADLILGPGGRHTFLEINPRGSFAFLGDPVAGRIADAAARLLSTGGTP